MASNTEQDSGTGIQSELPVADLPSEEVKYRTPADPETPPARYTPRAPLSPINGPRNFGPWEMETRCPWCKYRVDNATRHCVNCLYRHNIIQISRQITLLEGQGELKKDISKLHEILFTLRNETRAVPCIKYQTPRCLDVGRTRWWLCFCQSPIVAMTVYMFVQTCN